VKANRELELNVRKASPGPALLAGKSARDQVEVLEIATGEIALFWDTPARQTGKLVRALRSDLRQLETDAFIARWRHWRPQG
jgi:hypothetical protein